MLLALNTRGKEDGHDSRADLCTSSAIILVLFGVSLATTPPPREEVERTTIRWGGKWEPLRGWADWRLQWAGLALVAVSLYYWLW